MGRRFNLSHRNRHLEVCVDPIDEAWELWLCEDGRRLALGATVAIDKAAEAWRQGLDPITQAVERIQAELESGAIVLPVGRMDGIAQSGSSASASPLSTS
jgi:hypothetical protein